MGPGIAAARENQFAGVVGAVDHGLGNDQIDVFLAAHIAVGGIDHSAALSVFRFRGTVGSNLQKRSRSSLGLEQVKNARNETSICFG